MKLTKDLITSAGSILIDPQQPLKKRFRALFTLKNASEPSALAWIEKALLNDDSVLLKHECGYCMGQMMMPEAVPVLMLVLDDSSEDPIVRHECGEALGNIASRCDSQTKRKVIQALEKNSEDGSSLVSQTCKLSLEKISRQSSNEHQEGDPSDKRFTTQDPAPPMDKYDSLRELEDILNDPKQPLFNKYRALFSLRNCGSPECVDILGRTLVANKDNRQMDLMMHEIGYIFGQLCDPDSIKYLKPIIESKDCHEIARHECVEALGSIATKEAVEFLQRFREDASLVVKQSVLVALDISDYFNDEEQFQFLDE